MNADLSALDELLPESMRKTRVEGDKDAVLAAAENLAREFGEELTLAVFVRETKYTAEQVRKFFGMWSVLRQAVGLKPRARNGEAGRFTRECILQMFRDAVDELGPNITQNEFAAWTGISVPTIHRRWGQWVQLKEAAGQEGGQKRRSRMFTDAECLEDVWQTWWSDTNRRRGLDPQTGRPQMPTKAIHDRLGRIHSNTIRDRFGNWSGDVWAALLQRADQETTLPTPVANTSASVP